MGECQNCGSFVTEQFCKVFGSTAEDEVFGCLDCMTATDVKDIGVHKPVPEEALLA